MSQAYLGEIRIFAGTYAPLNWHFCDGTLLSISQYNLLYSLLGITYGGNNTTNFAVPDLRGRVPVHVGQGTNLSNYTLNQKGGAETVALTADNMPVHTHAVQAMSNAATTNSPTNAMYAQLTDGNVSYLPASSPNTVVQPNSAMLESQDGGTPHANIMPCMGLNYIICIVGLFPPRP